ncbi:hypothetical protein AMATHDRAFT_3306 [Amanita thiersii Skay4041]|uniref:Uncharacterized protein n=1 Tax=Amanita thiersii Skay4041 TaxID=703135 RepID=A0A2A9NJL2_9AGAR|nr:hypothetical protein AMATHDRAFT_3306 [Amanita thiersii Skay4041]
MQVNAPLEHLDVEMIVHNFVSKPVAAREKRDGSLEINTSSSHHGHSIKQSTILLESGFALVKDALSRDGWKNLRERGRKGWVINPHEAAACFLWAQAAPTNLIHNNDSRQNRELREWGELISEDEIFDIQDLEEFHHERVKSHIPEKRKEDDSRHLLSDKEILPQRKKRKVFVGSIHNVIPRPHFYPTAQAPTRQTRKIDVPVYKKTRPIPIPPYSEQFMPLLRPFSEYSRTAWLIPVRGTLPWSLCTPAFILDDSEGDLRKEEGWIQWTKAALAEFWTFLLGVRSAGRVGQLGLSFHIARTGQQEGGTAATLSTDELPGSSSIQHGTVEVWSLPLCFADYVKIYHEANNAMSLRSVLDAWAYVTPGGQKIRVLKGTRLVLVDERSKGILIS